MRLILLGGLLRALHLNLRQGESGVAAFECGKVFRTSPEQPATLSRQERMTLAGILYGRWPVTGIGQEGRPIEFTDLKGVLATLWSALRYERQVHWQRASEVTFLHPGQAATLTVNGVVLGLAGALHPGHCAELGFPRTPWVFELDYPTLVHYARSVVGYQPLSRFPATVRDVAIVADEELPVQAVIDTVHALGHPLVMSMRLFDLYRGDAIPAGKKSLAYSTAYRAADRTLTAEEVNTVHAEVIKHIVCTLGVEVRT
jgi:phenylalanyl-tRNA synthetase beta chain